MSKNPHKYLLWLDLETTGTDPGKDPILEIGTIITQAHVPFSMPTASIDLAEAAKDYVVRPEWDGWSHRLPSVVLEMHTRNGLLVDVFDRGQPLEEAEADIIERLGRVGKPHEFVLAGSGVGHFDRAFIDAQMPKLAKWLRYYTLDVGVIRRFLEACGYGEDIERAAAQLIGEAKTHRALDDIQAHLAEAQIYAERFVDSGLIF